MKKYLGAPHCLAQSLIEHVDIPARGTERVVRAYYRGSAG